MKLRIEVDLNSPLKYPCNLGPFMAKIFKELLQDLPPSADLTQLGAATCIMEAHGKDLSAQVPSTPRVMCRITLVDELVEQGTCIEGEQHKTYTSQVMSV